ncbi:chaperone protein HtpG [Firmicutes bacterium CAG:631]|nr:chaperone protein HtpG [Firmicutes bacterium CAG:631]
MSEVRKFKTESKRLLDLMINSIYTNKEIFLRELISNASDAIDKYHYLSLTNKDIPAQDSYHIHLSINKDDRILTIEDNGIGMTYEEVINNLGTIAKSGSLEFLNNLKEEQAKDIDIIGQFGVGFYSAFMVSDKVVVETKSPLSEKGYRFTSKGTEKYEIEEIDKPQVGTKIDIYLRKSTEEEDYDQFLDDYHIQSLVKKYSDYVRYPITMEVEKSVPEVDKDGKEIENKYKTIHETITLNSMVPIWKKSKNEVSEKDLNEFYKQKFADYNDPMLSMFVNAEGMLTYNALLFIPKKAPYDLYTENYEKGLKLYTKGVFIMDKCKELIPDYLRFVKGLVDSSDLSLNISREILQQNRQLTKIATNIEKKVLNELTKLQKEDYDKYLDFFNQYGINFKYGIYNSYGADKEKLQDLLVYKTIQQEKPIPLKTYVENMKKDQEYIYFASAKDKNAVLAMPQMDLIKKHEYDVLILDDQIDEFVITMLQNYDKKSFKSINQGDLNILDEKQKEEVEKLKDLKKPLIEKLKEILKDDVSDVVISSRLSDSPVCLVSKDGVSLEMEKVLASLPTENKAKAQKVLELNPNHELFKAMERIYAKDANALKDYAELLYNQALLMEGFPLKDPVAFSNKMCELMIKSSK